MMSFSLTTIPPLFAIFGGSGYSLVAQAVTGESQNVHVYGGWGFACFGTIALWRALNTEREKRDKLTEDYHERAEERAKKSNERDLMFIKALDSQTKTMENHTASIKSLEKSYAIRQIMIDNQTKPQP